MRKNKPKEEQQTLAEAKSNLESSADTKQAHSGSESPLHVRPDNTSTDTSARAGSATQSSSADEQANHETESIHEPPAISPLLLSIKTLGSLLDDLERTRIMNSNRIGALDRQGLEPLPHLTVAQERLEELEHQAELELIREWRKHPLFPWTKSIKGAGEKTVARLIAEIGEPGVRPNVAKLWAYCGVGDPARKRRKGMTQEELFKAGNPQARKQCWLLSEAFVKVVDGPYRKVYDARRVVTKERVHAANCPACGPAGKPALPGSPWSLKHQHEDAKRITVKEFLKDMWIEATGTPRKDN